jgi:hypothetical protein
LFLQDFTSSTEFTGFQCTRKSPASISPTVQHNEPCHFNSLRLYCSSSSSKSPKLQIVIIICARNALVSMGLTSSIPAPFQEPSW